MKLILLNAISDFYQGPDGTAHIVATCVALVIIFLIVRLVLKKEKKRLRNLNVYQAAKEISLLDVTDLNVNEIQTEVDRWSAKINDPVILLGNEQLKILYSPASEQQIERALFFISGYEGLILLERDEEEFVFWSNFSSVSKKPRLLMEFTDRFTTVFDYAAGQFKKPEQKLQVVHLKKKDEKKVA